MVCPWINVSRMSKYFKEALMGNVSFDHLEQKNYFVSFKTVCMLYIPACVLPLDLLQVQSRRQLGSF